MTPLKPPAVVFELLVVFSIIKLSISAFLVAQFNQYHNYFNTSERDRTAFLLFASIWTIGMSALHIILFLTLPDSMGKRLLNMWIFWTAVASIIATLGGGLNCFNQTVFVYCGQLNALKAFAWLIWIVITSAIVVATRDVLAARRVGGLRGPLAI
ncbi:hypothetical protein J3R83DRAFT_6033 [Lanmaoa asiatica]|nr:hypothetical protein J3R83DRAFT_6033 [Lanmaoa asiatica]